ncbi:MAG: transcriptional regulator [Methyloligella sp.]|nr:MAG: transcriptional regulator [Methyloligella sp.]
MSRDSFLTGNEVTFQDDEIIVSKTNLKGHLTYANKLFLEIAGYSEQEVIGKPHNIIRHPDMPRVIFKMLWDTVRDGREVFAYVINRCKNGDHYWVYAHVTPSLDMNGKIIGYHSNRRVPQKDILNQTIIPLYKQLKQAEDLADRKEGLLNSENLMSGYLADQQLAYDEFIMTVGQNQRRGYR